MILKKGKWIIAAIARGDPTARECEVTASLSAFLDDRQTAASANGILRMIERAANSPFGPKILGAELFHGVDAKGEIWEFKKGRLRVLCFFADTGALVICSHVIVKQSQRTPPADVARAARCQSRFQQAESAGLVRYVEE